MGRGEYVRLLLEDAGIDYEYVRYSAAQWKEEKPRLLERGIRSPTMPYITVDGKYYGNTVPIMRFISKKLNKYQGENDDEEQVLDAYSDKLMDWAARWGNALFLADETVLAKYKEEQVPQQHKAWDEILSDKSGPYLLGEKITYADFVLYHLLEDDSDAKVDAEAYPHLTAFVQAIQARPSLVKFLSTDRK